MKAANNYLSRLRGTLVDYFFPKFCLNCRQEGSWLCGSCQNSLFFIDSRFCPFCEGRTDLFCVCERCRPRTSIKKVFSLFNYSDPVARKLIKSFKYRYIKDMIEDLEPLIRRFFIKYRSLLDVSDQTVLAAVPMHWYKNCERGFNQAEEIAKIISKILKIKLDNRIVIKKGLTRNQADLEMNERFHNLDGAFRIKSSPPKNIIIVDDVFTTGGTVREVGRALHRAGAENIQVITLAKG